MNVNISTYMIYMIYVLVFGVVVYITQWNVELTYSLCMADHNSIRNIILTQERPQKKRCYKSIEFKLFTNTRIRQYFYCLYICTN